MSDEMFVPKLPPEALELLADPRTADLKYLGPNYPNDRRVLKPANPPAAGESRYVIFSPLMPDSSNARVDWLNKVPHAYALGMSGLAMLGAEQPRFSEARKKPRVLPDAWFYMGVMIASPSVAAIMTRFDPAIQTVPIDWVFSDGGKLDGYVFLDVHRAVAAYDFQRSEMIVEHDATRKFIAGLGAIRALKRDLDPGLHAFREAFRLSEIFVSRELAAALLAAGLKMNFLDPATMSTMTTA
jgi:uncharacterized protein DUF1629